MILNAFKYVVIKESRYNFVVIMLKHMSLNPFSICHYGLCQNSTFKLSGANRSFSLVGSNGRIRMTTKSTDTKVLLRFHRKLIELRILL